MRREESLKTRGASSLSGVDSKQRPLEKNRLRGAWRDLAYVLSHNEKVAKEICG